MVSQGKASSSLCSQKVVNLQPVNEGIEPPIAGSVWIPEAEAVATVLVKVKLDRSARFEPRLNNTKLTAEKKVIGRYHIEHWWSILWDLYRPHAAIDRTDEVQLHGL